MTCSCNKGIYVAGVLGSIHGWIVSNQTSQVRYPSRRAVVVVAGAGGCFVWCADRQTSFDCPS